jgi:hypothetical protein
MTSRRLGLGLLVFAVCALLSACFFGRRGRTLDRAVEHTYPCAAAEGYRYEHLGTDRYRVHVCFNRADERYRHRAIFHCSRRRCASLSARAQQYFAGASGCPMASVTARETVDSTVFDVTGCNAEALLRCEMRDQEVRCDPVHPFVQTPVTAPTPRAPRAPSAPTTAGGEVTAPDSGVAP